jgi:hypothetical protein
MIGNLLSVRTMSVTNPIPDLQSFPKNRTEAALSNPPMNVFAVPFTGDGFQVGDRMIPATIALRRALKGELQSGQWFYFGIAPQNIKIEPALSHVLATVIHIKLLNQDTRSIQAEMPMKGGVFPLVFIQSINETCPNIGDVIPLKFDLKQMILFDSGTNDRIFPASLVE